MVVEEIQLSCEDVIEVHFEAKGSYTQLSKFLSATKRKIPKSKFSFPSTTELNIYKRGLKVPTIKQFTNTTGKTIGRVCDFKEVLKFLFSNKDVVQNCNWFLSSPIIPRAILINHTDGARQSLVIELVSTLLRLLNNEDVSRNPAALAAHPCS